MHRNARYVVGGLGVAFIIAGCRTATQVVQEPRVDLQNFEGNRGYLLGTPPAPAAPRKTTRQMVQTDIELPTRHRATPSASGSVGLQELAPPETDFAEVPAEFPSAPAPTDTYDTYQVKHGDTLWSIAADPAIYGDAGNWRRIFDANRDQLRSADRLRAGMTLRIPRGDGATPAQPDTEPDAQTTYSK
ncbi:MAG: LysM peptidoglycan-binding domain-containing protein [Candidatus Omnitrophica bacterium]|nr:LysM peptidoglycan-binding domain-containing protein [Candidatus Omnitrophota bacterium]